MTLKITMENLGSVVADLRLGDHSANVPLETSQHLSKQHIVYIMDSLLPQAREGVLYRIESRRIAEAFIANVRKALNSAPYHIGRLQDCLTQLYSHCAYFSDPTLEQEIATTYANLALKIKNRTDVNNIHQAILQWRYLLFTNHRYLSPKEELIIGEVYVNLSEGLKGLVNPERLQDLALAAAFANYAGSIFEIPEVEVENITPSVFESIKAAVEDMSRGEVPIKDSVAAESTPPESTIEDRIKNCQSDYKTQLQTKFPGKSSQAISLAMIQCFGSLTPTDASLTQMYEMQSRQVNYFTQAWLDLEANTLNVDHVLFVELLNAGQTALLSWYRDNQFIQEEVNRQAEQDIALHEHESNMPIVSRTWLYLQYLKEPNDKKLFDNFASLSDSDKDAFVKYIIAKNSPGTFKRLWNTKINQIQCRQEIFLIFKENNCQLLLTLSNQLLPVILHHVFFESQEQVSENQHELSLYQQCIIDLIKLRNLRIMQQLLIKPHIFDDKLIASLSLELSQLDKQFFRNEFLRDNCLGFKHQFTNRNNISLILSSFFHDKDSLLTLLRDGNLDLTMATIVVSHLFKYFPLLLKYIIHDIDLPSESTVNRLRRLFSHNEFQLMKEYPVCNDDVISLKLLWLIKHVFSDFKHRMALLSSTANVQVQFVAVKAVLLDEKMSDGQLFQAWSDIKNNPTTSADIYRMFAHDNGRELAAIAKAQDKKFNQLLKEILKVDGFKQVLYQSDDARIIAGLAIADTDDFVFTNLMKSTSDFTKTFSSVITCPIATGIVKSFLIKKDQRFWQYYSQTYNEENFEWLCKNIFTSANDYNYLWTCFAYRQRQIFIKTCGETWIENNDWNDGKCYQEMSTCFVGRMEELLDIKSTKLRRAIAQYLPVDDLVSVISKKVPVERNDEARQRMRRLKILFNQPGLRKCNKVIGLLAKLRQNKEATNRVFEVLTEVQELTYDGRKALEYEVEYRGVFSGRIYEKKKKIITKARDLFLNYPNDSSLRKLRDSGTLIILYEELKDPSWSNPLGRIDDSIETSLKEAEKPKSFGFC